MSKAVHRWCATKKPEMERLQEELSAGRPFRETRDPQQDVSNLMFLDTQICSSLKTLSFIQANPSTLKQLRKPVREADTPDNTFFGPAPDVNTYIGPDPTFSDPTGIASISGMASAALSGLFTVYKQNRAINKEIKRNSEDPGALKQQILHNYCNLAYVLGRVVSRGAESETQAEGLAKQGFNVAIGDAAWTLLRNNNWLVVAA